METEEVREAMEEYGSSQYGIADPIWTTYRMYLDEGKSISEIAEDVYLEEYEVRRWFKSIGLPRPATSEAIPQRPKKRGYSSLFEYFRSNDGESFTKMGEELSTNPDNVRSYYDRFIEYVNYGQEAEPESHWNLPKQSS